MDELLEWCSYEPKYRRFTIEYLGSSTSFLDHDGFRVTVWSVHDDGSVRRCGPLQAEMKSIGTGSSIDEAIRNSLKNNFGHVTFSVDITKNDDDLEFNWKPKLKVVE